jgi:ketosteroid isomerase-like protein
VDELEIVRLAYSAWNAGDIRPFLHHLHADVEWASSGTFPGLARTYHGHEGVLRWQDDLRTPFERFVVTVNEARIADGVVTARVHFDAVGATSGVRVGLDFVNRWHFRDGLIVRFDSRPLD